jgi:hypothetical protein
MWYRLHMDSATTVREVMLGDDGIDFVRWRLSTGGPLAQVLRHIDLNAGRAVALLPNRHPVPPTKLQEGGDLSAGDAELILHAAASKVMGHFGAAGGRGWALSEDRYDMGLGRYVGTPNEGRGTRVQLARVGDRGVYYLVGPVESSDVEDFLHVSTVRANVGALGVGGIDAPDLSAVDWEAEVLPIVTNHVHRIICEAFDELGFVFWEVDG